MVDRRRLCQLNCRDADGRFVPRGSLRPNSKLLKEISRETVTDKTNEWWLANAHASDMHKAGAAAQGDEDPSITSGVNGSTPWHRLKYYDVAQYAAPDPMHTCSNEVSSIAPMSHLLRHLNILSVSHAFNCQSVE